MPKKYSVNLTSKQMLDIAYQLTVAAEASAEQAAKHMREGFIPAHATKAMVLNCFEASMEHQRELITLFMREAARHRSGSDRKSILESLKNRNDLIDYLISEYTSMAYAYMDGK